MVILIARQNVTKMHYTMRQKIYYFVLHIIKNMLLKNLALYLYKWKKKKRSKPSQINLGA